MLLPATALRSSLAKALALVGLGLSCGIALGNERSQNPATSAEPLKVRFWADEIELTGAVPDQEAANLLRIAIYQSNPGKPIWDRLIVDPARTVLDLPSSKELSGLLLELALSAKDGSLVVTADEIIVSGLTDSMVTHSAFEVRLRPLAALHRGKQLKNRICIVHPDDLEPSQLPKRPRPALRPSLLESSPMVLADEVYGPDQFQIRAQPMELVALNAQSRSIADGIAESADLQPTPEGSVVETKLEATSDMTKPSVIFEPAEKIAFTMNSYLVGFDQFSQVDAVTTRIRNLPESAGKIILRGFPDTEGRHEFNDWLSVSRVKAVRRALIDAGIPEERFTLETHDGKGEKGDLQSVRVLVPRLPEPEPTLDPAANLDEPTVTVSDASLAAEESVTLSSPIETGVPVAR